METLLGLALKSLLIAGLTLAVLHATRRRSAAERSLIAHLGHGNQELALERIHRAHSTA